MNGQIQQTLHGYERGHRLLASSLELPQSVARRLLYLSDLSGSNRAEGFEQYLTGYPLPEISSYALSQTWDAPEMARPGCVFSHTLLIDFSDLAQVSDLNVLLSLFRRPEKAGCESMYSQSLTLPTKTRPRNLDLRQVRSLLAGLYSPDEPDLIIAASSSEEWLAAIMAVWSQMWPRLRRRWTFSTGSLGPRNIDGQRFALQVIPARWRTRMEREFADAIWLDDSFEPQLSTDNLAVLTDDCASVTDTELRKYLRHQAADLPPNRSFMPMLLDLWKLQQLGDSAPPDPVQIVALLSDVGRLFPRPDDAPRLKSEHFGPARSISREVAILSALAQASVGNAFDADALGCEDRIVSLWQTHRHEAEQVFAALLEEQSSQLGERMLGAIAKVLTTDEVVDLAGTHPAVVNRWLPAHPEWLVIPALWKLPVEKQRSLLHLVAEQRHSLSKQLPEILGAMIESGSMQLALEAETVLGPALVDALLQTWEAGKLPTGLSNEWLDVLSRHPSALVAWLQQGSHPPRMVAQVVRAIGPVALESARLPFAAWEHDLLHAARQADQSTRIMLHSVRCSLGLRDLDRKGYRLLDGSFAPTYFAVRARLLPEPWKQHLFAQLPARTDKLRLAFDEDVLLLGLWQRFEKELWELEHLFSILADRDIFRAFIGLLKHADDAASLKRLRRYRKRHAKMLTAEQREQLDERTLGEWIKKWLGDPSFEED